MDIRDNIKKTIERLDMERKDKKKIQKNKTFDKKVIPQHPQTAYEQYEMLIKDVRIQKSVQERLGHEIEHPSKLPQGYLLVGVVNNAFLVDSSFVQWVNITDIFSLNHFALLAYDDFITKDSIVVKMMIFKAMAGVNSFFIHDEDSGDVVSFDNTDAGIFFLENVLKNKFNIAV